ncbi:ATP-binding protein [Blastococcus colisei]|uniref:Dph6-related ATP pyrophosphatase n=1 Tax=Blastococcus colisei TaxID=1564162 RepID=UPI001153FA73|nr:ATP-binding protein [Blastococcus colisei]
MSLAVVLWMRDLPDAEDAGVRTRSANGRIHDVDRRTAALHWSGGKDSALALTVLLAQADVHVERLVTTVHPRRDESTVHGIPVELLEAQARSIGIPLQTVPMRGAGLDGYVDVMNAAAVQMRREGIDAFAFGDLTSSDVRHHKEEQFGPLGIEVLEPLWGLSSRACVEKFLTSGMRAVTVVVNADVLDVGHVGVPLDRHFIDHLPEDMDPSGELGEYHTFVFDGPLFRCPIPFRPSGPRLLEREIETTEGPRCYKYWLATPQPHQG